MNFNFSENPEYDLNTSLTEEMINLYGILTKFLVTEKINKDDAVFGDYSHMKSNNQSIYEMYMIPENTEEWDTSSYDYNEFGLTNFDNVNLFVAKSSFEQVPEIVNDTESIMGQLIVFPNNKIMEITDFDWMVPGVNNLFSHNDVKSVYKLTCKPYDFKLINELDNVDIDFENDPDVPYDTLDTYFSELIGQATAQDVAAEVTPSVTTVVKTGGVDTKVDKAIVDKTEDDVWGSY